MAPVVLQRQLVGFEVATAARPQRREDGDEQHKTEDEGQPGADFEIFHGCGSSDKPGKRACAKASDGHCRLCGG